MSPPAESLLARSVGDFLAALGDRSPSPGGGSVAAMAGSLAVAMARMVAAYSRKRDAVASGPLAALTTELERLESMLNRFVDEDAAAYAAYSEARAAKAGSGELQSALQLALAVPQELLATSLALLRRLDEHKSQLNPRLLSDLAVAAHLARAACAAADENVRVNAAELADAAQREELAAECKDWLDQADKLWQSIVAFSHAC